MRDLTTAEVGKLVSITGVVTRTSEVRPELLQGTFKCLECGSVIKNVEQQFKYTEVGVCISCICFQKFQASTHGLVLIVFKQLLLDAASDMYECDMCK